MATTLWIDDDPILEVHQILIEPKHQTGIASICNPHIDRAGLDFNLSGVVGNQIVPALINKFCNPTVATKHLSR